MRAYLAAGLLLLLGGTSSPDSLWAQTPDLPPSSVVNGASFRAAADPNGAVAPGALVAIFGANLAGETQLAMSVPLSTRLPDTAEGTSVTFNIPGSSISAPLFFVSSGQINAQVPFGVPVGTGSVSVQVRRGSKTSATQPVQVADVSPGIFTVNQQGTGAGAILHADNFQAVSTSAPARPGEFLLIFCTGLGPVDPPVPSGDIAPAEPLARTITTPLVNVGGLPATVSFSGLAPGFVGLYQVNLQVPQGIPSGAQEIEIIINGVPSRENVTIAVQ